MGLGTVTKLSDRALVKIARACHQLGAAALAHTVGDGAFDRATTPRDLPPHVSVGRHTYRVTAANCVFPTETAPITIGNFCSIAAGVTFLAHADHATKLPTTYPFRSQLTRRFDREVPAGNHNYDAVTRGPITLGHDVWIGVNAIVLSGVEIGTGAIVGAGAVVTRNVPAYAIAVGNPAHVVRKRYPDDTIAKLLASKWWDLPDATLATLDDAFYNPDIENFLKRVAAAWTSQ